MRRLAYFASTYDIDIPLPEISTEALSYEMRVIRTGKPWETAAGPLPPCLAHPLVGSLWKTAKGAEAFAEL